MCTLTYIALEQDGFLLTSSRDEQKTRKNSELPSFIEINQTKILRPIDGDAGGSWIGVTNKGRTLCLLNGAFVLHERNPPYRKSRGVILMDLLATASQEDIESYNFENIEPFTLIWIERFPRLSLTEYRWDSITLHRQSKSKDLCHIWSSSTLYTEEIAQKRELWLGEWLQKMPDTISIANYMWKFHIEGGKAQNATPREQILMQDNYGGTVSLTQIQPTQANKGLFMKHHNLVTDLKSEQVCF